MKVADCMETDVRVCSPDDTIQQAARIMKEADAGLLPVIENDKLVGTVTERDIALRAVAEGRGSDTPVREVMNSGVRFCFDSDTVEKTAAHMTKLQIRRLPVLDRNKRLVGVISQSAIARMRGKPVRALRSITGGPRQPHGHSAHF